MPHFIQGWRRALVPRLSSLVPSLLAALMTALMTKPMAAPQRANAEAAPVQQGANFLQARKQLLKDGWRPVKTHAVQGDGEPIGVESALLRAGIGEVDSCAMDRALCIFHYRKAKRCLRIVTSGEEVATMLVEQSDARCPEPRPPQHP
ncbi:hypothetical protein [Roseateles terrae]|uniref:Uncharacterized protein n=1 Tax=Roseateles terrae TaxID=431060 RepID=A0ABR6GNQ6_9BURK|nr:hypothetical protein [Roseateles terrae]MBB3192808.1 hypothetical protein [Roseateles terrae]OWQ89924.1 hypothetical protein CDN98_05370 [Roseateles terrae]